MSVQLLQEQRDLQEKIKTLQSEMGISAARLDVTYQSHVKRVREIMKINKELVNDQLSGVSNMAKQVQESSKLGSMYRSIAQSQSEFSVHSKSLVSEMKSKVLLSSDLSSLESDQLAGADMILESYGKQMSLVQELAQLTSADSDKKDEIYRKLTEHREGVQSISADMNDQSDIGRELLSVQQQLEGSISNQIDTASELSELTQDQKDGLEASRKAYEGITNTIQGAVDTVLKKFGTIQGATGGVLMITGKWLNEVGKVNKELGVSAFSTNSATKSAGALSIVFSNTAETVKGLTSEFGSMEAATFETQMNIGLMSETMGISSSEAVKLTGSFSRMGKMTAEQSANAIATTRSYAMQEGVLPSAVLSDMAGSTDLIALNAGIGSKNMMKMAVGAQKLGTNMQTLGSIQEGLLDFETSMTKELELGAMLGKNINLGKARELAYAGDLAGATRETLKQVGGIAAFNKMDYYQKKQTADLLGVSVGEFEKMATNAEKVGTSGSIIQENFSAIKESASLVANKYLGVGVGALGGWITSTAEIGANFKHMGFSLKGIGSKISKVFGKGGGSNIASSISENSDKSTNVSSKVPKDGGLKSLAGGLEKMGTKKVLFGALNLIPTALGMVMILPGIPGLLAVGLLGTMAGVGLTSMASGLTSMGKGKVAVGALVLGLASIALMGIGYATTLFDPMGTLLMVGSLVALGIAMLAFGNPVMLFGVGVMLLASVAMLALGGAIMMMSSGLTSISTMGEGILNLVSNVAGILTLSGAFMTLAGSIGAVGLASMLSLPGISLMGNVFGSSETGSIEEGSLSEFESNVLSKMDELISAVKSDRDVYMDREKVTAIVMETSEKSSKNVFGLNIA